MAQTGIPIYGTGDKAGQIEGYAPGGGGAAASPYFLPNTSTAANPDNSQWSGASSWQGSPTTGGSGQNNLSPSAQPIGNAPMGSPAVATATSPQSSGQLSYQQAQDNLNKGGLTGSTLTQATNDLKTKYNVGLQNAQSSNTAAPNTTGTGASMVADNIPPAVPPANPIDSQLKNDPGYQQLITDRANYLSTTNQRESLVQQYQDISNSLGLPAINAELINTKNIIDGSEDDIRNEITKAGGFATDSQVLAMTDARNKVLIKNYNTILDTKNDAQSQLTTLVGLAAQDRSYAEQQMNDQMQFDTQIINYRDKMQANAQQSLQNTAQAIGYDGLYTTALATGDPSAIGRIEQSLGMPAGSLGIAAQRAAQDRQLQDTKDSLSLSNLRLQNQKLSNDVNGVGGGGEAPLKATDTQNSAAVYAQRVSDANKTIDQLQNTGTNKAGILASFLPNVLKSADRKQLEQAENNFATSVLRRESGAAISKDEFDTLRKQYFPQPGDDPGTLALKAQNRQVAEAGLINSSGPAYGNLQSSLSTSSRLYTPQEIPSGYYQASDGLLYKK